MVKFLIMDVDGTLTDGHIYMGEQGELFKAFSIKDGCGIKDILPQYNIIPIIITGRNSRIVENRCDELNIRFLFQGEKDKYNRIKEIIRKYNKDYNTAFRLDNCAYIGDDINDIECMREIKNAGGIIGAPYDAIDEIKRIVDFVSSNRAGEGAVRDFIEWIIKRDNRSE